MKQRAIVLLLCLGTALVEVYVLTHSWPDAAGPRVEAVEGVLNGTPHWRAYQNRLLGPELVRGIQIITGASAASSLSLFFFLAAGGKTLAVYLLFIWLTRRQASAIGYSLAASALTIGCFGFWVYPWDYLDTIFYSLLLLAIVNGAGWRTLCVLFVFGLWNRETALALPLWLAIDGLSADAESGRPKLGRVGLAAGLAAIGIVAIQLARRYLFVHRAGLVDDPMDLGHGVLGNHVQLLRNIRELLSEWMTLGRGPEGRGRLITVVSAGLAAIALLNLRRLTPKGRRLMLWSVAVVAAVPAFGAASEPRIWIGVVPLWLFWVAAFAKQASPAGLLKQSNNE